MTPGDFFWTCYLVVLVFIAGYITELVSGVFDLSLLLQATKKQVTRDECMLWLREQIEREGPGWKVLCGGCGKVNGPDPRLPILLQVMLETLEEHPSTPGWTSEEGVCVWDACQWCRDSNGNAIHYPCPPAARVIAAVEQIQREIQ